MTLAATGGEAARLFLELGGAVVVLALAARLAARIGLSAVPFYLLGGVALGALSRPSLSEDFISTAAQVGVVLLLFTLGLEYTALELATGLRSNLRAGIADLVLNFPPGFAVALLLGWGTTAAVVLGGVTYISSSGIVAKVLADLGRLANRETPSILSVLVFEDLAMAVYLPIVAVLVTGLGVGTAFVSVGVALAVVAVVFVIALNHGHLVSRALYHDSDEVLLLSTVGVLLVVAGVSERANVSAAVGAFLLGIALSGPVAERARDVVAPLRDLFAASFFLFFALQIDLGDVPSVLVPAVALLVVTTATKLATGWIAAGAAGIGPSGRLRAGTALVARGEFSIVIAGLAVGAGLEPRIGALAAAYVLATAFLGPVMTRFADELGTLVAPRRGARLEGEPGRG